MIVKVVRSAIAKSTEVATSASVPYSGEVGASVRPAPPFQNAVSRWRGLTGQRSHILVACMPKSGSTFLTDVISELPGFRRAVLVPAFGRREQELDEDCLRRHDRDDYVAQNHIQYSDWTGQLCGDYGIAPIVLVRSLLDVIVSLRDHLRNEGPVSPIFYVGREHAALDDTRLELLITRLALPWYLGFYMSWREAPDALMVRYEDLAARPREEIGKILAFAGVRTDPSEIDAAIDRIRGAAAGRFNVGVAGRGGGLQPEVLRAVLELLDFYPEAAQDPYIAETRAQCVAALEGAEAPTPAEASPPAAKVYAFVTVRRWWRRNAERLIMRGVIPLALMVLALGYWLWPNDLIPDTQPYGYVDDIVVVLAAGLISGRLTAYKPRLPRQRR